MAGCGKQVWDCWKFRFRWNLRVFIPRLLRVTTTHSTDQISIWNLYLLAWTLFSSWYKYANPSLIRPQMAACGKLEWNFQKSRLRQNLHVLITHLRRVTTAHSIDRIAFWNLFHKARGIYSSWCKCEWPSSIVPHCKMAEAFFVLVRFLLLSQLKFSAAINNVSQHFLGVKF